MSKYIFKSNQRYAIFKAFKGICQWCMEPVLFKNLHVDHVLAEELLNDPVRLNTILHQYGLPSSFNINDYENWIPAHPYCNQHKGNKVYEGAPFIRTILDRCAKYKELAQRIELKLNRDLQLAELLVNVQAAVDLTLISEEESINFVLKEDIMEADDEEIRQIKSHLEESLDYQTKKMVQGLMEMAKVMITDEITSLCTELGLDWKPYCSSVQPLHPGNDREAYRYKIINSVDYNFEVEMLITWHYSNNNLTVEIINATIGHETVTYNVRSSIDWTILRKEIRQQFKSAIKKKM